MRTRLTSVEFLGDARVVLGGALHASDLVLLLHLLLLPAAQLPPEVAVPVAGSLTGGLQILGTRTDGASGTGNTDRRGFRDWEHGQTELQYAIFIQNIKIYSLNNEKDIFCNVYLSPNK